MLFPLSPSSASAARRSSSSVGRLEMAQRLGCAGQAVRRFPGRLRVWVPLPEHQVLHAGTAALLCYRSGESALRAKRLLRVYSGVRASALQGELRRPRRLDGAARATKRGINDRLRDAPAMQPRRLDTIKLP